MVSHGLFERMACEERQYLRKTKISSFGPSVGLKQTMQTMETMRPPSDGVGCVEADERDTLQNEGRYTTRQSIPNAVFVSGLVRASEWPR
jgi:hypothetical protein